MKFELSRLAHYDDGSIIAELQRVASLVPVDVKLTRARFNQHAKVSSSTVAQRFGGWQKALLAAGLGYRYSGRTVSDKMKDQIARDMTDEQLVAELQRVASELQSEILARPDFNSRSDISSSAFSRRFGSWNKALRAAGLRPVNMGRRHTEDDYFENLLNVWTHFGRQPKCREMNSPLSVITSGAYEQRWGSWTKALIAFLDRVNADQSVPPIVPPEKTRQSVSRPIATVKPEDQRRPPLGLRYNVLRRDNFKCVLCGNSPATDPKCTLHVDHIFPFSKNGKTVVDNLRTLCGECNIGKSDQIEAS